MPTSFEKFELPFLINLGSAAVGGLLVRGWQGVRKHNYRSRADEFWGSGEMLISYGSFSLRADIDRDHNSPFVKEYSNGTKSSVRGPRDHFMGESEIRSAGHLIKTFAHIGKKTELVLDQAALSRDEGVSMIAIGSPGSNEMSGLLMTEAASKFVEFRKRGAVTSLAILPSGKTFERNEAGEIDHAVIIRVFKPGSPGNYGFICAGLSDWGSSGASYYLAHNWEKFASDFPKKQFGAVIQARVKSDPAAKVLYTCELT